MNKTMTFARAFACCAVGSIMFTAAGCSDTGSDTADDQSSELAGSRRGIDYAFSKPSPASIRAAGYTFASRYLSRDASKDITASERRALQADGIDVVANWEAEPTGALNGYNQGVADARDADSEARAAGMPASRPIYFSVDFDVSVGEEGKIGSYLDGVASVIGRGRAGAYGGYRAIKYLFDTGKIQWGWQTYAWSGGQWDGRAQMRQIKNGITVGGADCDSDLAVAADFGQWEGSGGGGGGGSVALTAFQANTGFLYTEGSGGTVNWEYGMMKGTSPSIAALSGGGYEIAFQSNAGELWTVGTAGNTNWHLGMMAGTSPAIAALPNGSFEVAFQANTSLLYSMGPLTGTKNWELGMMANTSPAIAALPNGDFVMAMQANTGLLYTTGPEGGARNWELGLMANTSPAITALSDGGYEIAFQANTSMIYTTGTSGGTINWERGMMAGTSPSITAAANGKYEIVFQANTGRLFIFTNQAFVDTSLGVKADTSPSISPTSGNVLFQANTGELWLAGVGSTALGMMAGTSPATL